MKILVTGGAGFIGSHLVDELLAQGHGVRVLDALVPQVHGAEADWPAYLAEEIETIQGDVRDPAAWKQALQGVEAVYHLAAEVGVGQSMYEITRYMSANAMGTALMLELLVSERYPIQKVVVASSMSIYGEGAYCNRAGEVTYPLMRPQEQLLRREWEMYSPDGQEALQPIPTNEEKPLNPTSIYAISKRDQEEMCLAVGRAYNIPTTALRFFNVYGPRQALSNPYTGVAAIFSSRLLNGKAPLIFEDGLQSRDFVHVKDIVQGLVLAMEKDEANYEAINIGSGRRTPIRRLAEMLIRQLNVAVEPEVVSKFRAGDIRHCYADITKAQKLLGYQPKVRLEDSLPEMVEWLSTQIAEDKVEAAANELSQRGLTV